MTLARLAAAAALTLAAITSAIAQDYPSRPVTFIVGFPPGSASDAVARNLGARLADRLGKPFVIENKPGAGSIIAAQTLARAAPDGHTIMIAPIGTMAINQTLYKSLPYDPLKDFALVAHIASSPYVLVVGEKSEIKSVQDIIKFAKAGKKLTFASSGAGTGIHLTGELFKRETGIEMQHIPYRGPALAMTDIIEGRVDMIFSDPATVVSLIKGGKVRGLGVSSKERFSVVSDVPTIAEAGVPGFESRAWHIIIAPAGTPEPIVAKLRSEFRALAALPDVKQQLLTNGLNAVVSADAPDIRKMVETEAAFWADFLKKVGLAGSE
jgi:tripartite-type tricarboxylate transporter receptor subunit TctC